MGHQPMITETHKQLPTGANMGNLANMTNEQLPKRKATDEPTQDIAYQATIAPNEQILTLDPICKTTPEILMGYDEM